MLFRSFVTGFAGVTPQLSPGVLLQGVLTLSVNNYLVFPNPPENAAQAMLTMVINCFIDHW